MIMKMQFLSRKCMLILVALLSPLVSAAEPKAWDVTYAEESPLDVAV